MTKKADSNAEEWSKVVEGPMLAGQAIAWSPVSRATRSTKRMSRPSNIAVGSQIVLTPRSSAPFAASTAAAYSASSS